MYQLFCKLLVICVLISVRPSYSILKNYADSFRLKNINSILLNCQNEYNNKTCEPQLIINIDFTPNLIAGTVDSLLILDETYEPTKRQNLKLMSPYIIVVRRGSPMFVNPHISLRNKNLNNKNKDLNVVRVSEGKMVINAIYPVAKEKVGNESHNIISYVNLPSSPQKPEDPHEMRRNKCESLSQSLNDELINYNNYATNNIPKRFCEKQMKKVEKKSRLCNSQKAILRNRKNTSQPLYTNNVEWKKNSRKSQELCDIKQKKSPKSSFVQKQCATRAYSIYNLSLSVPYLVAKIRIFKKRKKLWWMIMPEIVLNNLSGTFVNENLSILLTTHGDILRSKHFPANEMRHLHNLNGIQQDKTQNSSTIKYLKNTPQDENMKSKTSFNNGINKNGQNVPNGLANLSYGMISPTSINSITLTGFPSNTNQLGFNILDNRKAAFSIKMKMTFRENAPQENIFKIKIPRIVTDATTKDALQISVDVINKGLKAHEYLISIINCPLSEVDSTSTTVKKMLLPSISVTITFLLPFIMGSKRNLKFNCELIANAQTSGSSVSSRSKDFPTSKRSFEIETHSRCFCIWNCRCHCIGKIETHVDFSVCQKMSYATEKDAGLFLNCPPYDDSSEICLMDVDNDKKHIHEAYTILWQIVAITLYYFASALHREKRISLLLVQNGSVIMEVVKKVT